MLTFLVKILLLNTVSLADKLHSRRGCLLRRSSRENHIQSGIGWDRNAPERRFGSFLKTGTALRFFLAHSKNELMQWRGVRRLSVCKLLHKSLLLAEKWPDRHQTCIRWSPGQRASRVCSTSRSRSKVT